MIADTLIYPSHQVRGHCFAVVYGIVLTLDRPVLAPCTASHRSIRLLVEGWNVNREPAVHGIHGLNVSVDSRPIITMRAHMFRRT